MTADQPAASRSPDRRFAASVLMSAGALGLVAAIAVAASTILREPNLGNFVVGILGGGFVGLLITVAGAWIAMSLNRPPKAPDDFTLPDDPALASVIVELEATRQQTLRDINQRSGWRVPLCAAGGVAIWFVGQFSNEPGDLFDAIMLTVAGGFGGYVWASLELSNRYDRLYKSRVLPKLASSFGDLTWRPAVMPDLAQLRTENIFRAEGYASADDEIAGTWRGLPLNIVELKLEKRSGKNTVVVFDGLIVSLELNRSTGAVTAVIADGGAFGNLRDRMTDNGRKRVALEDPVFEKVYEVYGTDQIAARALLHPAFMEKLLALGELPEFQRPLVLASGRKIIFVMPKRAGRDLFGAPGLRKPAASRDALTALRKDIAAVLAAADAVIDLDHRFTGPPPLAPKTS